MVILCRLQQQIFFVPLTGTFIMTLYMYSVLCIVCFILYIVFTFQINIYKFIQTDIEKLS